MFYNEEKNESEWYRMALKEIIKEIENLALPTNIV
jgi:hypothetical protein